MRDRSPPTRLDGRLYSSPKTSEGAGRCDEATSMPPFATLYMRASSTPLSPWVYFRGFLHTLANQWHTFTGSSISTLQWRLEGVRAKQICRPYRRAKRCRHANRRAKDQRESGQAVVLFRRLNAYGSYYEPILHEYDYRVWRYMYHST